MNLLARIFHRSRHAAAGPRPLTGRHARRAAARIAETTGALPTVIERDRAATLAHIRRHDPVEDADTSVIDRVVVRALDDEPELVRPFVAELRRMQGGW